MNLARDALQASSPVVRAMMGLVMVGLILVLAKWAAPVLTPIMLACFLAALVAPLHLGLEQRGVSSGLALTLLMVLMVGGMLLLAGLLWLSVQRLREGVGAYQMGLDGIESEIAGPLGALGITGASVPEALGGEQLARILLGFLGAVARSLGELVFALVLVAFLLLDARRLLNLVRTELRDLPGLGNLPEIAHTVITYFAVRTRLNLVTGVGVGLLALVLGVDYALLWGFLAFALSYVPYIGLAVAAVPPTILALAEHDVGRAAILVIGIILVDLVAENILEPRMTGKAFKLSPAVVMVSFFVGGWLLGPTGLLLAMPITVTIMLITEQDERTRWLASLMGSRENLGTGDADE